MSLLDSNKFSKEQKAEMKRKYCLESCPHCQIEGNDGSCLQSKGHTTNHGHPTENPNQPNTWQRRK